MAKQDLTDITVVLDRSGSMSACQSDMEGGLNALIDEQKQHPGEAVFTLVQFNTEYEFVHRAIPIKSVPKCGLHPRGSTALLDAVGRAIVETGERLGKTPEDQRPGLVVFVIITDGEENASKEFKKEKIKEMITEQQNTYNWKFTFLGANQDAFAEAGGIGIAKTSSMSYSPDKAFAAVQATSASLSSMRSSSAKGEKADWSYTTEQREASK